MEIKREGSPSLEKAGEASATTRATICILSANSTNKMCRIIEIYAKSDREISLAAAKTEQQNNLQNELTIKYIKENNETAQPTNLIRNAEQTITHSRNLLVASMQKAGIGFDELFQQDTYNHQICKLITSTVIAQHATIEATLPSTNAESSARMLNAITAVNNRDDHLNTDPFLSISLDEEKPEEVSDKLWSEAHKAMQSSAEDTKRLRSIRRRILSTIKLDPEIEANDLTEEAAVRLANEFSNTNDDALISTITLKGERTTVVVYEQIDTGSINIKLPQESYPINTPRASANRHAKALEEYAEHIEGTQQENTSSPAVIRNMAETIRKTIRADIHDVSRLEMAALLNTIQNLGSGQGTIRRIAYQLCNNEPELAENILEIAGHPERPNEQQITSVLNAAKAAGLDPSMVNAIAKSMATEQRQTEKSIGQDSIEDIRKTARNIGVPEEYVDEIHTTLST